MAADPAAAAAPHPPQDDFDPRTAEPTDLDDSQMELFRKLRDRFKDDPQETMWYLRVLIARKWDIDAAEKQLRESVEWRREYGVATILDSVPPQMDLVAKFVKSAFHKHDTSGRPLYIERTGLIDVPALINIVTKDNMIRAHVWGQEFQLRRCLENSKKFRKLIPNTCNIIDLKGLNLAHKKGMMFLKQMTDLDQAVYPENLGAMYVINAPWIFGMLWSIASRWVDSVTRKKIHVLGSNYKQELAAVIGPENLPEEYGGTCKECNDGKFCVPLAEEKTNPEMYDPELKEISIASGKLYEEHHETRETGTTVSWFYRTIRFDIKFSVKFVPHGDDQKHEVLQEPMKLDSELARVQGSVSLAKKGKVVLTWDNTYSYFHSKTLRYNVSVSHTEEAQDKEVLAS